MRGRTFAGVFTLAGMAVTLNGSASPPFDNADVRCSVVPFPGARSGDLFFVGIALADTALVGPGSVKASGHGGHLGNGRQRDVYGQLIQITQPGPESPDALRELPGGRHIIVVPWDYDPECAPTYWTRSAAWVEPGLEGFHTVRLRPANTWEGGVPVADAYFAALRPYPHGPFFSAGHRGTSALRHGTPLTPREYFSLYSVLPTISDTGDRTTMALARLRRWEADNPTLVARYPAGELLAAARRQLQGTGQ
jgi:hypothetical protein